MGLIIPGGYIGSEVDEPYDLDTLNISILSDPEFSVVHRGL